jgi:type IV conjugative transfer system coupling protein TraD
MTKRSFSTDSFTRGGQVFAHQWRMRVQNIKTLLLWSVLFAVVGVVISLLWFDLSFDLLWDFYLATYLPTWLKVNFWPLLQPVIEGLAQLKAVLVPKGKPFQGIAVQDLTTRVQTVPGQMITMRSLDYLVHPWTLKQLSLLGTTFKIVMGCWSLGIAAFAYAFKQRSKKVEESKVVKGKVITSPKVVSQLMRAHGKSQFELAPGVPYVKGTENLHTMIMGSTGHGKTNCMNGLLQQLRNHKERALILDTGGGYTDKFYDPARGDILLNPFDHRSVVWDLWQDCKTTTDFDRFAAALIPEPQGGSNPVWHKNAREVIATAAEKLGMKGKPKIQDLVDYACWKAVKDVKSFYQGTPVEALMSADGRAEEVVHSVRMNMTDSMKRLALLPQEGDPFSIEQWVKSDQPGWLFITCHADDRSTLGSLMQFWIAQAIQALLGRAENPENRLWFIMDELFSLEGGSVPKLELFLQESRKYGGCGVLGFQDLSGLHKAYGREGAKNIISNCNTKIIFRTPEPESAKYISSFIGDQEVIESVESFSMGSHQMRDGVNLNAQRRMKPIVAKEDIMDLLPLQSYIALPKALPICQVNYPIYKLETLSQMMEYRRVISLLPLLEKLKESEDVSLIPNETPEGKLHVHA